MTKEEAKKKNPKEQIILGIDPGTNIMGYGVIRINNAAPTLLDLGIVKFGTNDEHTLKLKQIFLAVTALIEKHLPDEMAIEAPFYGKNIQSMLKLGRAQGVAIAAAVAREIGVMEYSPRKIKQSVTGNGNASKEQVAAMLVNVLKGVNPKTILEEKLDATDAVAVALCHYYQNKTASADKKFSGWDSFIKSNPERKI